MSRDSEILIAPCDVVPGLIRFSVDDLDDPNEIQVTGDQIHITVLRDEEPTTCFKLSTTSARDLVARLTAAIERRESA